MNSMHLSFNAIIQNETFARTAGIAFILPYNPSMDEVMEIKTILAEAITNCIIHGYPNQPEKMIDLTIEVADKKNITITVEDKGCGIDDLQLALQPMMTTRPDLERSGMGMTIMQTFSDDFKIESIKGKGTKVILRKNLQIHE